MGGSGSQTTVQKADPWGPSRPYLERGLKRLEAVTQKGDLVPTPFMGDRVAGFGEVTTGAQQQLLDTAGSGPSTIAPAQTSLVGMMDPGQYGADLQGVRDEILANAIPAATAQFALSGMTDSGLAQEEVTRAATQALAPFEYGAYQTAADRAIKASTIAPSLDPTQFQFTVGQQQDALDQAEIDAWMQRYYEGEERPFDMLSRYSQLALGYGGQGGTQTGRAPGASTGSRIAGAGMMGLGAYGALGAAGVANPYAAPIAAGLSLASLL